MDSNRLTVVEAAIKYKNIVYSVEKPGRHHDVIRLIHEKTGDTNIHGDQGFILSDGRFVRRKPAGMVARRAGQIKEMKWPSCGLFSEDLW